MNKKARAIKSSRHAPDASRSFSILPNLYIFWNLNPIQLILHNFLESPIISQNLLRRCGLSLTGKMTWSPASSRSTRWWWRARSSGGLSFAKYIQSSVFSCFSPSPSPPLLSMSTQFRSSSRPPALGWWFTSCS